MYNTDKILSKGVKCYNFYYRKVERAITLWARGTIEISAYCYRNMGKINNLIVHKNIFFHSNNQLIGPMPVLFLMIKDHLCC